MTKHVTVRLGWHDNKWDGNICKNPKENFYCRDNYSLLSPRIQKRINVDLEDELKNKPITEAMLQNYLPPCYWSINAFGKNDYQIQDRHPFSDSGKNAEDFKKQVPPMVSNLKNNSIMTWCFQIGYARGGIQRYVTTTELDERVERYQNEIIKGKSIVFYYANYSNPLTGDDYKYALLGAGLVDSVSKPQEYDIPQDLVDEIRSGKAMRNFPLIAWQFPISHNPEKSVLLPFHEYLDWVEESDSIEREEKFEMLQKVVIPIQGNLIYHFKYVSMHVNQDNAIYLLYLMKKSIKIMKEQDIIEHTRLEQIEKQTNEFLKIAWSERNQYPGFKNAIQIILKNQIPEEGFQENLTNIQKHIEENFESIDKLFKSEIPSNDELPLLIRKGLRLIRQNKDLLEFLSMFDFSIPQFEGIRGIINKTGFETLKKNPYLILEQYERDFSYEWNIDDSDFGISLNQIDTALIPDLNYAQWDSDYLADSPERIRAVIVKILRDAAREGHSCLSRKDILQKIEEYPLFYISEKLSLDLDRLLEYEKQPIFKEKFIIQSSFVKEDALYQLKEIRQIEKTIEDSIQQMLKKNHTISSNDSNFVKTTTQREIKELGGRIDKEERESLYKKCLSSGLFVMSGKAGSGKTSAIVNLVQHFLNEKESPIFVFTPTGKSNVVIRERLKAKGLVDPNLINVSTIHRFLYSAVFDALKDATGAGGKIPRETREYAFRLLELISKILDGKLENLDSFIQIANHFKFSPRILILDEASMINETMMAALLSLINVENLKHLIIVGDEKQLPAIGVGRPFVDIIYHLKKENRELNYIRLQSNLRFDSSTSLGGIADIFESEKEPTPSEIIDLIEKNDQTLQVSYFNNDLELRSEIKKILQGIENIKDGKLNQMFGEIFNDTQKLNLDKAQIIAPRRVGRYGTMGINSNVILEGNSTFLPRTKLICEENRYISVEKAGRFKKILALANGSMGYIMPNGDVKFDELEEFQREHGWSYEIKKIKNEVRGDTQKIERDINYGYAITIHKSQGSDYEHVILVIPEISLLLIRELLYTAFTRTKIKLHLLVHQQLKEELPTILIKAYQNSSVEERKTLMFGIKLSPFRPFSVDLKNGKKIEVRSKIEYIIAKTLDELGIDFEYETPEFLSQYHIRPDFKLKINQNTFLIEHLGNMKNYTYRNRWYQKIEIYKKIGIYENLVTTTEELGGSNIEENIKKIISDMKTNSLKRTEGSHSIHHYNL